MRIEQGGPERTQDKPGAALSPGPVCGWIGDRLRADAARMDVKFPILGFLKEAEATGYDLKNRFRDPVGFSTG